MDNFSLYLKTFLTFTFLFLYSQLSKAQDIIATSGGNYIHGKVIEVGDSEIKYKKSPEPNEPTYSVKSKDVYGILFSFKKWEVVNNAYKDSFLRLGNKVATEFEKKITGGKGRASLRTLNFNSKSPNKNYDYQTTNITVQAEKGVKFIFENTEKSFHAKTGSWSIKKDSLNGFEWMATPAKNTAEVDSLISKLHPYNNFPGCLGLLGSQRNGYTYLGLGNIYERKIHLFFDSDYNLAIIDEKELLPFLPAAVPGGFVFWPGTVIDGYWFPSHNGIVSGENLSNQCIYSDFVINRESEGVFAIPDIQAINASLENKKTIHVDKFMSFAVGDNREKVLSFIKENRLKYKADVIKSDPDYEYISIGNGKLNTISLTENDSLSAFDFIDFCFYKNGLRNIRFAKYTKFNRLDVQSIIQTAKLQANRCHLTEKLLSEADGVALSPISYWYKPKGDNFEREKRMKLKKSQIKNALISTKALKDENNYFMQELFLGLTSEKDITFRDPAYIK